MLLQLPLIARPIGKRLGGGAEEFCLVCVCVYFWLLFNKRERDKEKRTSSWTSHIDADLVLSANIRRIIPNTRLARSIAEEFRVG